MQAPCLAFGYTCGNIAVIIDYNMCYSGIACNVKNINLFTKFNASG